MKVQCRDCERISSYQNIAQVCSSCGSEWLVFIHSDDVVKKFDFSQPVVSLWDFFPLLPVKHKKHIVSLGEGGSPVTKLSKFGEKIGLQNLYMKDERFSNTGSFKDRGAAVAVSALNERGVQNFVFASTGNMGTSYAAYTARAGIQAYAFVPAAAPEQKIKEMRYYGTKVKLMKMTYDECKQAAKQFADKKGFVCEIGTRDPLRVEAKKTIAFELYQQLPRVDRYFQAASGGTGFLGFYKGLEELKRNGLLKRMTKIHAVQVRGCAPMYTAYKTGKVDSYDAVIHPQTTITTLSTGNPIGYPYVASLIKDTNGDINCVTDRQAFQAVRKLAQTEGILIDSATGVALAGIVKLAKQGAIKSNEYVVFNGGSHGLREFSFLEKHV